MKLPASALTLARAVRGYGVLQSAITPCTFIVGGAVRDAILRHETRDIDIEVYGVPTRDLERLLRRLFGKRVKTIGKAFAVFHIQVDKTYGLDVSIPRRDSKIDSGHRGFTVTGDPAMTIEDATRRRDFTINAILYDPLTKRYVDPFHGRRDLTQRILRVVDTKHFAEDPLRAYRALQLTARFNLHVEPKTLRLLNNMVRRGDLKHLSRERMTQEWTKLLMSRYPARGLALMQQIGIAPWDETRHHPDRSASRMWAKLHLTPTLPARLALLLMPLRDPRRRAWLNQYTWHETIKRHALAIASTCDWFKTQSRVAPQPWVARALRRRLDDAPVETWRHVQLAQRPRSAKTIHALTKLIRTRASHELIRGADVIALGIPAGPRIGTILKEVQKLDEQGKLSTKKEALLHVTKSIPSPTPSPLRDYAPNEYADRV